jgi:hypothetical protein
LNRIVVKVQSPNNMTPPGQHFNFVLNDAVFASGLLITVMCDEYFQGPSPDSLA